MTKQATQNTQQTTNSDSLIALKDFSINVESNFDNGNSFASRKKELAGQALEFVSTFYSKDSKTNKLDAMAEQLTNDLEVLKEAGIFGDLETFEFSQSTGKPTNKKLYMRKIERVVKFYKRALESLSDKQWTIKGTIKLSIGEVKKPVVKDLTTQIEDVIKRHETFKEMGGADSIAIGEIVKALQGSKKRHMEALEARKAQAEQMKHNGEVVTRIAKLEGFVANAMELGIDATAQAEELKALRKEVANF